MNADYVKENTKVSGLPETGLFLSHGYRPGAVGIPRNVSKIFNVKPNFLWLSPFIMKLNMAEFSCVHV